MGFGFGAIGYLAAFAFSVIGVAVFTFRAMRNLHRWDEPSAQMSAGWAVGWYVVPFANLIKPLDGMGQIVEGSFKQAGKTAVDTPGLGLWWGTWIIGQIIGNVSNVTNDEQSVLLSGAVSLTCLIVSAFALLRIMTAVEAAQTQAAAARVF